MTTAPLILVVDDEPHIVHVLGGKLRSAGYRVSTANNGEAGLELARTEHPALIVTDFQMPGMDGLAMCLRLREHPPTEHTPIIMLTSRGHMTDGETLKLARLSELMSKPFSPKDVLARIRTLIGDPVVSADATPPVHPEKLDAVHDLARTLGHSYETIDTLYAVAGLMGDVSRPVDTLRAACRKLLDTTPFDGVALVLADSPQLIPGLRSIVIADGGASADAVRSATRELCGLEQWRVIREPHSWAGPADRQSVAAPVKRSGQSVGSLMLMWRSSDDPMVSSHDVKLLEAVAASIGSFVHSAGLYHEQTQLFLGTVHALTAAIDAKDRYTRGHSERVAQLASTLALATGSSPEYAERVRIAGLVHDVGKIGVPEAILCKPGKPTDAEFDLIKAHPVIGHRILKGIAALDDVLPGVLYHHERPDGRGYPEGLRGDAIPPLARLIALADTFDAMSSTRSYRPALPRDKVLAEIRRCAGTQFDPHLADAFTQLDFAEYDAMVARHAVTAPAVIISAAA